MPNEPATVKLPKYHFAEFLRSQSDVTGDVIENLASELINCLKTPPYWVVFVTEQDPLDVKMVDALVSAIAEHTKEPSAVRSAEPPHVSKTRIRVDAEQATRKGKVTRYSRSNDALPLHTDGSNKLAPPSLVAFAMERPDPAGGGASMMLAATDLVQELSAPLIDQLRRPEFPFVGERRFPILDGSANDVQIRYYRNQIDSAVAQSTELPRDLRDTLDEFDRCLADSQQSITFSMDAGDVVLMDNRRVLHGRESMSADSPRLMHRFRSSADALETR